jgi:exopolysaccharide production protein ExoZ
LEKDFAVKINSIQVLRALAAWAVVLHHFGRETSSSFGDFFALYGNFGVDIFFVISGFIMYHVVSSKEPDVKTFMIDRTFRIVPAYWLATALFVLEKFLFPEAFAYSDWSLGSLLSSMFFVPVNNPAGIGPFPPLVVGWTLNVEMFFYALLCVCFIFGRFKFVACCIALVILPYVYDREWFYGSILGTRKLYEFMFGIVIGTLYEKLPSVRQYLLRQPAFGVSLIPPAFALLYLDRDGMRLLSAGLFVIAFLLLEDFLNSYCTKLVNVFVKLGEYSYSTYLFHMIIIGMVIGVFGLPSGGTDLKTIFEWVLVIFLTFSMSVFGFKVVEMSPLVKRLKGRALSYVK